MGDGARRFAFVVGMLRVAERRTLFRACIPLWFEANPEAGGGVTAEGGGVVGCGGEGGLLVVFWKKDCRKSIR
jgi:hypothetical protein